MIYNISDNIPQPKAHILNNWERTIKLPSTTKRNSQWSNSEILIYNIQCRLATTKLEAMLSRIVDIS